MAAVRAALQGAMDDIPGANPVTTMDAGRWTVPEAAAQADDGGRLWEAIALDVTERREWPPIAQDTREVSTTSADRPLGEEAPRTWAEVSQPFPYKVVAHIPVTYVGKTYRALNLQPFQDWRLGTRGGWWSRTGSRRW